MTCSNWYVKRKKKIIKTISWTIIATITTFIIAYSIQREANKAAIVAALNTVFKIFLYYIHEEQCDKLDKKGYCSVDDADTDYDTDADADNPLRIATV